MAEELKIVIVLKDEKGFIGVSAPDCDPVFAVFDDGLDGVLQRVPVLLEEARVRWSLNPKYPKCERPPAPAPAPAASRTSARRTPTASAKPKPQQASLF